MRFSKGIKSRPYISFFYLSLYYRVVIPKDKGILFRLVLHDAEFRINIVLHLIVISIQMVWGDIQQDSNIRLKIIHVVQLEAAQFDYINIMR